MTKFIGEPWKINEYGIIVDNTQMPILAGGLTDKERAARRDLIHAAPDLYEALAFAKSCLLSGEPWDETCEQVIDGALKKARGEE